MSSADQEAGLLFIPTPFIGHLISAVEMAKLIIARDHRLSVTVLIMKFPLEESKVDSYSQSVSAAFPHRIRFVTAPPVDESTAKRLLSASHSNFMSIFVDSHKSTVRDLVSEMSTRTRRLAGFVIDMFCTPLMDVAAEFGLPSFVFFVSSAAFLGLVFHIQALEDDQGYDITQLKDSVDVPTFSNSVPAKVLPSVVLDKEGASTTMFTIIARKLRETKGIMVNTFADLEPYALESLAKDEKIPTLYPVGPVLNLRSSAVTPESEEIMRWLDDQPQSSVVFLCFGSMGTFGGDQVVEIARALESGGHRFLWALRRPPPKAWKVEFPGDYEDLSEVLPEGFLERTAGMGRVIGWAPQVAVLSHRALGGFVSHCGWNSTLEGLWCGVPVAAWPLFAEQKMNAFQMVCELGLAIEMHYRRDFGVESEATVTVTAAEIESGIKKLMDCSDIKEKVKEMSEKSRIAVAEGGSSYNSIGRFIEDAIGSGP